MALLDIEGCTKYRVDTDANRKDDLRARMYFPGVFVEMGDHPLSGKTIYDNGSSADMRLLVVSGDDDTIIAGCRFRIRDVSVNDKDEIFTFSTKDAQVFHLAVDVNGALVVERSITSIEAHSHNFYLEPLRWYYIEAKIKFSNTVGTYEIKVDGRTIMSDTNVDTLSTGTLTNVRNVMFGLDVQDQYEHADMYICNTTGSSFTDFIGDIHIETLSPDGDGNRTDWTPDSGLTNYTQVDEANPDRDTSYVETSTAGDDDLYTFAATTIDADTVKGVNICIVGKSLDAGRRLLNGRCRSSVSESTGIDMTLHNDRYRWVSSFIEQNPNGPAAWTDTTVNAAEFGVTLTT